MTQGLRESTSENCHNTSRKKVLEARNDSEREISCSVSEAMSIAENQG